MAPPIVITPAMYRKASRRTGVSEDLLYAVLGQESGGGRWETSPKGAQGPAQLMPGTARALEQRYGINTRTSYGNLLGGAYYLKEQLDRFGGDTKLALAAYNAGPGAVQKYGGVPPYAETQNYVSSITSKLGDRRSALTSSLGDASVNPGAPRGYNPNAGVAKRANAQPRMDSLAAALIQSNNNIIGIDSPDPALFAAPPQQLQPPVSRRTGDLPGVVGTAVKPATRKILAAAQAQVGQPYVWGGESRKEGGFDCSGLIYAAYLSQGITIPRTTGGQVKVGKAVKWGAFRPGDLIFANGGKHVVLYVGGGKVLAAPHTGEVVQYQPVEAFTDSFYAARRYL